MINGTRPHPSSPSVPASERTPLFESKVWAGALAVGVVLSIVGAVFVYSGLLVANRTGSWWTAVLVAAPYWIIAALFVPPSLALARRVRIDEANLVRCLVIHLIGAIGFASLHGATVILFHAIRKGSLGQLQQAASFALINLFSLDCFVYGSVVGGYYVVLFYRRSAEAAERLRASRLDALRIQLAPHLLFNTLNLISMLSLRGDQKAVRETLARLGDMLRIVLEDARMQEVPLARELELLNTYLQIQRTLFGNRLIIERDVASDALDALVPRLVLQPLVENAIVHGVAAHAGPGIVVIQAAREQDTLSLRVVNSESGPRTASDKRSLREGVGFGNVRERLDHLYGGNHRLHFHADENGVTTVQVSIPFHRSTAPVSAGQLVSS